MSEFKKILFSGVFSIICGLIHSSITGDYAPGSTLAIFLTVVAATFLG